MVAQHTQICAGKHKAVCIKPNLNRGNENHTITIALQWKFYGGVM